MSAEARYNLGLAALVTAIGALLLFGGPVLDAIDAWPDHHAEHAQAQDLQVAINQAVERGRFEQAAQHLCGPQAAWSELADGSVQCRTKHGRPTITVQVAP